MGLAYGMFFTVTRDPAAGWELLAIRDLIFTHYHDAPGNRFLDSLTYDLSQEVDTRGRRRGIVKLLVPGTAVLLPALGLLSDPGRRAQFTQDLRAVTANLIARHNANRRFADQPWAGLAADRDRALALAWDAGAERWNARALDFAGKVEPDSAWWVHDEADQTLAALDLDNGFAHAEQLAGSAQTWLDIYVDRESPARETYTRVFSDGREPDRTKSFFGKNMLHNPEHALFMFLHGRALEGRPETLHYALPAEQALTLPAAPHWFDAASAAPGRPRPRRPARPRRRRGRHLRDHRAPHPGGR